MTKDNSNVLQFGVPRTKAETEETETGDKFPVNNYVVVDIDDEEFYGRGFLIFTPHHCAIMADLGAGAVPVLVVPLIRVKTAEMVTEQEDEAVA